MSEGVLWSDVDAASMFVDTYCAARAVATTDHTN